jgi:hypothetical protein
MASQPLNENIKVYRTVRGFRNSLRNESVKALTGNLRALALQVPGEEVPSVGALTRDANLGVTPYDRTGRPVVVGARAVTDFASVESLTGIAAPFAIGNDKFVENSEAGLEIAARSDLQKQARDL